MLRFASGVRSGIHVPALFFATNLLQLSLVRLMSQHVLNCKSRLTPSLPNKNLPVPVINRFRQVRLRRPKRGKIPAYLRKPVTGMSDIWEDTGTSSREQIKGAIANWGR